MRISLQGSFEIAKDGILSAESGLEVGLSDQLQRCIQVSLDP